MAPSKLPALSIPFNIAAVLMLLSLRSSAGYTGTNLPMQQHQQDQNSTSFLHSENSTEDINWMKVDIVIFERFFCIAFWYYCYY